MGFHFKYISSFSPPKQHPNLQFIDWEGACCYAITVWISWLQGNYYIWVECTLWEAPDKKRCVGRPVGLNQHSQLHKVHCFQGIPDWFMGIWYGCTRKSPAPPNLYCFTSSLFIIPTSWLSGNELSGSGVGASVNADQYGKDLINLKAIIKELYNNSNVKPLLAAPGGFYEESWYAKLLQVSGPNTVNVVTHHIYNLGAGESF